MTNAKLLLVEDDLTLGETLKERLEKENYLVTWATSKAEALSSLAEKAFDLILLDVGLPDGSGFDLARTVRSQVKGSEKRLPLFS
jgi:DNA-binding response OmpR family regulator